VLQTLHIHVGAKLLHSSVGQTALPTRIQRILDDISNRKGNHKHVLTEDTYSLVLIVVFNRRYLAFSASSTIERYRVT
jgi:hypothetical protein